MLNVVAIMGRLARDPELRQTTNGKSVAAFTIACDRNKKDGGADWIPVTAWERTAEFVCKYFQKGSLIAIDGRLQSRSYQDRNGNNRTAIEVVASNIHFAGKNEQPKPGFQPAGSAPDVQVSDSGQDYEVIDESEDLPF